ncbi:MAG: peroxidase family protein [Cyanobacteria bacterium J06621_11]
MLNNSSHTSSLNASSSSEGTQVWQSGWIEELCNQLENGTFNGLGNVVVDDDITGTEQQILSDLSAIDRMLVGTQDIQQMLSEVRDFAEQNRNTPLNNPANFDSLTGTNYDAQAHQAATSLTEVLQYVQSQGLPDLTAEIGSLNFDDVALPGEQANLSITLKNEGGLSTRHAVTAKIYAQAQSGSTPIEEPPSPIEIGSLNFGNLKLSPGRTRTVTTRIELPDNLAPGDYNIFVAIDTDGNVPEANEANNIVVASQTQTVAWQFGNIDGKNRVLNLSDTDGDNIRFQLKGNGYGEIAQVNGVRQLSVYGTTDQSEVVIKGNGDGHILGNILIDGNLKRFYGNTTDLTGNLTVTGSLDTLKLDDVSNAQINIGDQGIDDNGPNRKVDITLGDVNNLTLSSAVAIDDFDAASWTTSGDGNNQLHAPEIRELDIKGDFSADVVVAGDLKTAKVAGSASGIWTIGGDNRLTKLGATTADWSLAVDGQLNYLDVQSTLQGTIATDKIKRVFIGGDLNNVKLLVGADLGADGVLGGDNDIYNSGEIEEFIVNGNIFSSVIGAGLDPRDSAFTNGNERLVAGGRIRKLTVRGNVSDDSLFAAESWPKKSRIGGQIVDPETDARFLTVAKVITDIEAPVVTLQLASDTGSADDDITSVATLVGTVSDQNDIVQLQLALTTATDTAPLADRYVDASQHLDAGSFTLDSTALAAVLGQPLTDNRYTLSALATDSFGNVSDPVSYSYTFDQTGPALLVSDVQTTATAEGNIRLIGSVDEAVTATVTLSDNDEAPLSFDIAVGTFEQSLQTVPTAPGDYTLNITLTDVAGNQTQTTQTFSVAPLDDEAPVVTLALLDDTGASDTDGITSVATIIGTVSDQSDPVRLSAALSQVGATPVALEGYVDISDLVQAGRFELNEQSLSELFEQPLTGGSYHLYISAEDAAGNQSEIAPFEFTLDATNPVLSVTELQTVETADGLIQLLGSIDAPSVVTVSLAEQDDITFAVDAAGAFEQSLQVVPTEAGDYALNISVTDTAGNTSTSTLTFEVLPVDTEGPVVTLSLQEDTGNANDLITSNGTLVGTVADENATISLKAGFGNIPIDDFIDISNYLQNGQFTLDADALASILGRPLSDGSYQLNIVAEDILGNRSKPFSYSYQLDTTNPTLSLISPQADGTHSSGVRLVGSVDEAVTVSTTLGDGETTGFTVESAGEFNQLLQSLPLTAGANQLALTITDAAGNSAQTTVDFTVDDSAFVIGPNASNGWAVTTPDSLTLGEADSYIVQATLPVELGQAEGSRTLRFAIDAAFDTSDTTTAVEDRFALYLVDPNNPQQTLLDNDIPGTPVFALTGENAEYTPGLVRYDGEYVEIDLTSLGETTEGETALTAGLLVFQVLNQDADTGSQINIDNLTNAVDPEGTAGLRFPVDSRLATIGGELDLTNLSTNNNIQALFSNVRFNAETGEYTAELRLRNTGDTSISRQAAVVFTDLPDGIELVTTSGTDANGNSYVNLRDAIRSGGLQAGATTDGIAITFSNPEQLRFTLTPEILVGGPNLAPVFPEIGPLTTLAGQRIEIDLAATDPNGDRITYSLRSDGELPTGKFDGTGKLVFEPTPNQIGTYDFTLVATDGATETTQQLSLTVEPDPDTTTRISGQILDIEGNPLANLPIGLGRLQVVTDAEGYFSFVVPQTSFPTEEIDIDIPFGDPAFDPFRTGTSEINLRRTTFDGTTGTSVTNPLRHPNLVSTFMDGSMVYGSNASRAAALRTNDGTGRLKVSDGNLLPINNSETFPDGVLPNANRGLTDPDTLFATGDVRANENIGLAAMHTVFVREHNRLADEISAVNPDLSGEEIYQRARKLIAAQIQQITYSEYLPLLIGDNTIADYAGYDNTVDPAISHLFSAAAFRMGHTQSFDQFLMIGDDGQALPSISLNQSTFNPGLLQDQGIDPILRGLFAQSAEAIDTKVLSQLRNTLFGPPGSGGIDLAAVDIQRGRDVGLPDYNQARIDFGLDPVTSFAEITSDTDVQAVLEEVYGTVDDIDAIVGGLAEDAAAGSMVGEFFQKVIADQFTRLRDGDRFWYENGQFTADELSLIRETSLSALLERNTEITGLADNLFSTGRNPAELAAAGTVAEQSVTDYATFDGSNNNLENPTLGTSGTHLRVDYTQEYGDGIRTLAGEDRANVREISNQIFAQSESIPDETGATGYMLAWSQFMGHDLSFAPAGAADTLKIYGTEYESGTDELFPFVAEKLNLVLGHEVYAGVNNVIERPIYLPALDIANNVQTVDASGDITVTNDAIGAAVFVEANAITDNRGNPFTGALSISEVPRERTPAVLPKTLSPSSVVTIQPGEMVFTEPALLTLPNEMEWEVGTTLDLWSINPTTGDFEIVGTGQVNADGSAIETIEGGIRNSSWHFFSTPAGDLPDPAGNLSNRDYDFARQEDGAPWTSDVLLQSGVVMETHDLVTYQSLGATRGVQLSYDSLRADPRYLVHFDYSITQRSRRQMTLVAELVLKQGEFEYKIPGNTDTRLEGLEGGEHFWKIPGADEISAALQADLKGQKSGRYEYDLTGGVYIVVEGELSGASEIATGHFVHVNSVDSFFGSGWGLSGLQELVENGDGSVLLMDGDGSELVFEKTGNRYQSPAGDFSTLESLPDGTFQRTLKDQTVYQFNAANQLVSVTDRNSNETTYVYNDDDQLVEIVDPVGLKTAFKYSNGRVKTIVDPFGRETTLKHDDDGNLVQITDPDETSRTFEYDETHHITAEIDKRGNREETFYDNLTGRANKAIRKDKTKLSISHGQGIGLFSAEETSDFFNAPVAYTKDLADSLISYSDESNTFTAEVDSDGKITRQSDVKGQVFSIERDDNTKLVTARTNARGQTTEYTYDEFGNLETVKDFLSDDAVEADNSGNNEPSGNESNNDEEPASNGNSPQDDAEPPASEEPEISNAFGTWKSRNTFSSLSKLDVKDLDGDGALDFAATGKDENIISVMFGDGGGGVLNIVEYVSSNDLIDGIKIFDADGDGDFDIVTADEDYAQTLINEGGSFQSFRGGDDYYGYGSEEYASTELFTTRIDGDDIDDLIVSTEYNGTYVLVGSESGVFEERESLDYSVGAIQDINGDGNSDIVSIYGKYIDGYVNRGSNIFGKWQGFEHFWDYRHSKNVESVEILDINQDSNLDLVIADVAGEVTIVLGEEDNTFSDERFTYLTNSAGGGYYADTEEIFLHSGDLNADGNIDFVRVDLKNDDVVILYGDGEGTFPEKQQITFPEGSDISDFVLGDTNGDDKLDLIAIDTRNNQLLVSLGNPDNGDDGDGSGAGDAAPEGRQVEAQNRSGVGQQTFEYDPTFSQLTSYTDETGRQVVYDIDPLTGNRLSMTQVVGELGEEDDIVTSYTYTPKGLLSTVSDDLGRTTAYYYDGLGRVDTVVYAQGTENQAIESFTYDEFGNVRFFTDANGTQTEYRYDLLNRVQQIIEADPDGAEGPLESPSTVLLYDEAGNLDFMRDARGYATEYEYDAMNRLTVERDAYLEEMTYQYNRIGQLESVTDKNDNTTTYTFDARGRVTAVVAPIGVTEYRYDGDNNLTRIIDPNNHRTAFIYDARNRVVIERDHEGKEIKYSYDIANNLIETIDRNRNKTTFIYDDLNRLAHTVDAYGLAASTEYDAVGNVSGQIDRLGNLTSYTYDNQNRLKTVTDALGGEMSYRYDAVGNLRFVTDEVGRETEYLYDGLNRQVAMFDPDREVSYFGYDELGNLQFVSDENEQPTVYEYDKLNRLESVNNAIGGKLSYTYDDVGNLTQLTERITGSSSRTTTYEYDKNNRRTHVINPLKHVTLTEYDAAGNVVGVTDHLGHYTRYKYDSLDRVVESSEGLFSSPSAITKYTYDAAGNLLSLTDPVDNVTTYTYDKRNQLKTEEITVEGDDLTRTYRYNGVGDLSRVEDRNGRVRSFGYDALNRLSREDWMDEAEERIRAINYDYFADSRLQSVSDPDSRYAYTYDGVGRLASVNNQGTPDVPNVLLTYGYDAAGNLVSKQDSINGVLSNREKWVYDEINRVTSISQSGAEVTNKRVDFAYDLANQLLQMRRYRDLSGEEVVATTDFSHYDAAGRLRQMHHVSSGTTASYSLDYDAINRLTRLDSVDGVSRYRYDDRDQLTVAQHNFQDSETYSYDANGNRTIDDDSVGDHNRIVRDDRYTYQYDDEGNLTQRTEIETKAVTEYRWDYRNRLTKVITKQLDEETEEFVVTKQVAYTYDALDRRIEKAVDADGDGELGAQVERFAYDGDNLILSFDQDGKQTHRYFYGPGVDQLIADEVAPPPPAPDADPDDPEPLPEVFWTLTDHLGSVRDVIDSTGELVNHITYDSYGNITAESNPEIDVRFGFTGQEVDPETGLYYYNARYYSPEMGRFLSEDSLGFDAGDANLYRYVFNSPTNYTDPTGNAAFLAPLLPYVYAAGVAVTLDFLGQVVFHDPQEEFKVNTSSLVVSGLTAALGYGVGSSLIGSLGIQSAKAKIALQAVSGASLGAGEQVVSNSIHGKQWHEGVAISAAIGAVADGGAERVSQNYEALLNERILEANWFRRNPPANEIIGLKKDGNYIEIPSSQPRPGTTGSNLAIPSNLQRRDLPIQSRSGFAKHHLISISVAQEFDVMKFAAGDLGYNINRRSNGISLPTKEDLAIRYNLPMHTGGHLDTYYDYVRGQLFSLQRQFDTGKISKNSLVSRISRIESLIDRDVRSLKVQLQHDDPHFR